MVFNTNNIIAEDTLNINAKNIKLTGTINVYDYINLPIVELNKNKYEISINDGNNLGIKSNNFHGNGYIKTNCFHAKAPLNLNKQYMPTLDLEIINIISKIMLF